uniref:Uncharacterized protein n=1 Tax=Pseudomonas phage HRDY3 TaxID=3236930 RepID=A0AB39CDL8_9VIRU
MQNHTPIDICKAVMRGLSKEFPAVMFSPRTSCVHSKNGTGWESADLVLYAHNDTELELRLSAKVTGDYTLSVHDGQQMVVIEASELPSNKYAYVITDFYRQYREVPAADRAAFVATYAKL